MSWTILINTNPGHFKFWSYNGTERCWGRIGTAGQSRSYPVEENIAKYQEKLNEGYTIFARDVNYRAPSSAQVMAARQRSQNEQESNVRASTIAATRIRQQRTQQTESTRPETETAISNRAPGTIVPEYDRNHTYPTPEPYSTDAKGFINYRRGYSRNNIYDPYIDKIYLMRIADIVTRPTSIEYIEAERYFNRIQPTTQYNKPDRFPDLRDSSRPTYVAVFYKDKRSTECLAIYGVNISQHYCDFLAIKTNIPQRTTLLKFILDKIAHSIDVNSDITFKIKNAALRNEIKNIAEYYTDTPNNGIKYNIVDLRNGLILPQRRPTRWIE